LILCIALLGDGAFAGPKEIRPPAAVRAMMLEDINEGWEREKALSGLDPKSVLLRVDVGTCTPDPIPPQVFECRAKEVYRSPEGAMATQDWGSRYARQGRRWIRVVAVPAGG
jgi:hypothetical protein